MASMKLPFDPVDEEYSDENSDNEEKKYLEHFLRYRKRQSRKKTQKCSRPGSPTTHSRNTEWRRQKKETQKAWKEIAKGRCNWARKYIFPKCPPPKRRKWITH